MKNNRAERYINFGQFFDMSKDADFIGRLIVKKDDVVLSVDDTATFIEDPETGDTYLAYSSRAGYVDPSDVLEELMGITGAKFHEIAPKPNILFAHVFLFQVILCT
jgi:hypothetical protein